MNKKDFIFFEHARAGIFNVFTAFLCQPEEDIIKNGEIFDTLRLALDIVNPECSKIVGRMQEAVKQNTTQELLIEYTKLFIGPFKTLVPPYSSLYFGNDTLMSDETVRVINYYKKSGLKFDEEIKELDANNRDKSFSLWENQQEFFDKHYKKWVPEFCAKVATETSNEYFKVLSECLNKFINNVKIPAFPN